jgi:hypothetical protein
LEYCRLRLAEDPHLWASMLFDELVRLGFAGSYPSLTAASRAHRLRPHCEPCQASKGRDSSIITHPPAEETQWDWVKLPNPPSSWGLGREAHLLVGSLAHSGRWRAVLQSYSSRVSRTSTFRNSRGLTASSVSFSAKVLVSGNAELCVADSWESKTAMM